MAKSAKPLQLGKNPRPLDVMLFLHDQPTSEILVEPLEPRGNAALSRHSARRGDGRSEGGKRHRRHGGRSCALLAQVTCLKQIQDADVANVRLCGVGVVSDDGLDIVSAN